MPLCFEVEERIARAPDVVWTRLTDWETAPAWMNGVDGMAASGPTEIGTTLAFASRGKTRPSEITHVVPGREVTLTSQQGPVTAVYCYRCEPDGDGTRVRLSADLDIRGPLRLFGPLLRTLIRRADAGQLAALKRVIESG